MEVNGPELLDPYVSSEEALVRDADNDRVVKLYSFFQARVA